MNKQKYSPIVIIDAPYRNINESTEDYQRNTNEAAKKLCEQNKLYVKELHGKVNE